MINPFTPAAIASTPDLFFGRTAELSATEMSLQTGSLLIQGGLGIGKSSLLAQVIAQVENSKGQTAGSTFTVVGSKDCKTTDDLSRLILEKITEVDEKKSQLRLKFPWIVDYTSEDVVRNFQEGRHYAALERLLSKDHLEGAEGIVLIAIDEADKCPVPVARTVRQLLTYSQQQGVSPLRFALAGVNPFYKQMINEDQGTQRFFSKRIELRPMLEKEAVRMFQAKLEIFIASAEAEGRHIALDEGVVELSVSLSGGHPHVLQLLGSHIVTNETLHADNRIDTADMVEALRMICYDDRGYIYEDLLQKLRLSEHYEDFRALLGIAERGYPTRIMRDLAQETAPESLEWLCDNNILAILDDNEYGLVDEFLKIRMLIDASGENRREQSSKILAGSDSFPEEQKMQQIPNGDEEDIQN